MRFCFAIGGGNEEWIKSLLKPEALPLGFYPEFSMEEYRAVRKRPGLEGGAHGTQKYAREYLIKLRKWGEEEL